MTGTNERIRAMLINLPAAADVQSAIRELIEQERYLQAEHDANLCDSVKASEGAALIRKQFE